MKKQNFRTLIAVFLLKSARWLEYLIPAFLTPKALLELNSLHFQQDAKSWIEIAESGFFDHEEDLFRHLALKPGRALCLGAGAGREVFALARQGFEVVGVEQVESLVEAAQEYAKKSNTGVTFIKSEITAADFPERSFDYVFLMNGVYSYIPGKKNRAALHKKIKTILKPGGLAVLSFFCHAPGGSELRRQPLLRWISRLSGNTDYEIGSRVMRDFDFIHYFVSPEEVEEEAVQAGWQDIESFGDKDSPYLIVRTPDDKAGLNLFQNTADTVPI